MPKLTEKQKDPRASPRKNVLPGVLAVMEEAGFPNVSKLWVAFNTARFEQPFAYNKVLDIVNGNGCLDADGAAYSPEGELLAEFLKVHPQDLFGELPADPHDYEVDPDDVCAEERTPGFTQPEDYVLQREREKALQICLDRLESKDKKGAQVLRWLYGLGAEGEGSLTIEEIAGKLGVQQKFVRYTESRASARLKWMIERSYAYSDNSATWPRYTLEI